MGITIWVVIAYIVITSVVGVYAAKRVKGVSDFFVAQRNLTAPLLIVLLFAELIAGASTVGNAEMAYDTGIVSVTLNWGTAIAAILFAFLLAGFYRSTGKMSLPESIRYLWDEKTRVLVTIVSVIVYFVIYAVQPIAAAAILAPMVGMPMATMAFIATAVIVIVSITGGLRGIAWMNSVHAVILYVGLVTGAVAAVIAVGGFKGLATLPPSAFDFAQPGIPTMAAWFIGSVLSLFAAATVGAVCFSAKSERTAKIGTAAAGLLILPFALAPALIGLSARIALPDITPAEALWRMSEYCGTGVATLVSVGVIAAIFSTAPMLLLVTTTMLSRDFFKVLRPQASEKSELLFARIALIVLGFLGVLFGLQARGILLEILGVMQVRAIIGLVLVAGVWWKRIDATAAFWTILAGSSVGIVWYILRSPFGIEPLWPSLAVGIPTLIALTFMRKRSQSQ